MAFLGEGGLVGRVGRSSFMLWLASIEKRGFIKVLGAFDPLVIPSPGPTVHACLVEIELAVKDYAN